MVASVFQELTKAAPLNHFTIGINDDVTQTSLDYDPEFSTEDPHGDARHVLRPGRGWHGRREQEHHQDHRRRYRRLRAGLLRVRLEEVGRGDDLASALQQEADSLNLPHLARQLRRLPPVQLYGAARSAEVRGAGSDLPAEQSVRQRRGLGQPAALGAEDASSRRS